MNLHLIDYVLIAIFGIAIAGVVNGVGCDKPTPVAAESAQEQLDWACIKSSAGKAFVRECTVHADTNGFSGFDPKAVVWRCQTRAHVLCEQGVLQVDLNPEAK